MSLKTTTLLLLIQICLFTAVYSQEVARLTLTLFDPNNDLIVNGNVEIFDQQNQKVFESNKVSNGNYRFEIPFGKYIVKVNAPGFESFEKEVEILKDTFNLEIYLDIRKSEVIIESDISKREQRLNEVINNFFTTEQIAELPETGEEIREELKRRFGSDAIFRIDGDFDGSQIPPREQISSIKIINNVFDAEFHEIASVIIDIRTKNAANDFHGFVSLTYNDSNTNAKNPFDIERQPEQSFQYLVLLNGPIIPQKTSFSFTSFGIKSFDTQKFLGNTIFENNVNLQKTKSNINYSTLNVKNNLPNSHILNVSYQYNIIRFFNIGVFDLPERGITRSNPRHKFTLSESGVFGKKYLNDFRFEFGREFSRITPRSDERTIIVLDAFNSGGSGTKTRDEKTTFLIADNLAFDTKKHSLKFGFEIEYEKANNVSENNLNGRFIFSSLQDFQNQRPRQFQQTLNATKVNLSQFSSSFYFQDYFNLSKPLQISLGLRYEWQNNLQDFNNFSPRIGFVWSPEKSGKFIVRGGFGIFYEWFETQLYSSILSNDGRQGQNLIIINPGFPNPFDGGTSTQPLPPSISRLADNLVNPKIYAIQNAFNYKINKFITLEGIYTFKRGLNHFRSRDINAPINGIRPNANFGRIQFLESSGKTTENSFELRMNNYYKGINFFTNYQFSKRLSDFSNALSLPTDSYNLASDKGISDFHQRHKLNVSFDFNVWKIKVSPAFKIESGFPYTITTGRDDNGDTVFNDRPFGIERNSETGEWTNQTDMRFQWKIPLRYLGFGEKEKRSINMNANVRNFFNVTNFRNYVGNQTSPFFMRPTSANTPRSIDLGFSFIF